jgi:hypothetical protein
MKAYLTMTNGRGEEICAREEYDFDELRAHPGFSMDERRCFLELLAGGLAAVEWTRGCGRVRVERDLKI